ncbi:hypothetical protein M8C21_017792 [Ambrosia artemisiifolia]|uniref:Non-specific lipid-transfer protein n=1 Tax=Ambrosia artemisiifolia TaxID=4212 RepID=A0AAD5GJI0_AMBAR|nr:hypothetical protein M8C21_017792 [Ambrosia artemisiifolia]
MAGGSKAALVAVLITIVAATIPCLTESAVTCKLVVRSLTPCATYLIRGGRQVPAKCCNGVQSLYKAADTKPDRQMACRCMEQASKLVPAVKEKYANSLPEKCDVDFPYKITPTFNCSTVQ